MKVADLDQALYRHVTEEELGAYFTVRGIALTEKGENTIQVHSDIIKRHPQKKY